MTQNGNSSGRNAPIVYVSRTDQTGSNGLGICENKSYTLDAAMGQAILCTAHDHKLRRITPLEAERLQGFPDGWTEFGSEGETIPDSKRYAAIGNSLAIPCVDYIMAGIAEHLP